MGHSLVILGVAVSPIAQKVNIISGIVGRCLSFMKQYCTSPTNLSGEQVLPGFVLDLKGIL